METIEAFKELMEKYNENRAAWIGKFGSEKGFDAWFTSQATS